MAGAGLFRSVLVGDDGSPEAGKAVEAAFSLAKCWGAEVVLLCVLAPASAEQQAEGVGLELAEEERSALRGRVERAAEAGRAEGLHVIAAVAEGEPEREIERFVAEHGVDLLVVGHREVSAPRRWIEGSRSAGLARKLKVSVLVVHPKG